MEMNKYFLQMKGKPPSLSRFGGHTSAVWYDHSHKAAWHPVPLQGFLSGQYFRTKPQPCPSPQSHILTTQSLLGHRHRAQTPQFGNSPDLRNTGLQACVFYRSSSLPWHKAPPSLAKEQEEKHSCSGSWGLNGALFQKTQKAMKMSIYHWEGGELQSCSLCGFAKSSLHGRIDEHSVPMTMCPKCLDAQATRPTCVTFQKASTNVWFYELSWQHNVGVRQGFFHRSDKIYCKSKWPGLGTKSRCGTQSSTPLLFLW